MRDEHFANELKITKFYVLAFVVIFVQKMTTMIQAIANPESCNHWCKIFCMVGICFSLILLIWYLITAYLFFFYAKRHRYFLYRKDRVRLFIQATLIIIGILSNIIYGIIILKNKSYFHYCNFWIRLTGYTTLLIPPFGICFTFKPNDFFHKFNMFPEQLRRVSAMQYTYHNFDRFRWEESESFSSPNQQLKFSNEKGLLGIGLMFSTEQSMRGRSTIMRADMYVNNESVVQDLRVDSCWL